MPTPEKYFPKYPIWILSKGRYESRYTMKALDIRGVPYNVAVEPQEVKLYQDALKNSPWATVHELPFSNHGMGGGPARNWIWENAKAAGFRRHWILDDNIFEFWRFYNNCRIKFTTGAFFRAWEDWNDRFLNMPMTGLQYKFFVMDNYHYKPFLLNTRLMSCILIENSLEHRWRGKWNEDVDISLRTLKSGYCTALSYTFLCGKARTGTIKGGNTTEIYGDGTFQKSKMLADLHPDVVKLVKRYGRWHHDVDITGFANNKPIIDPNVSWDPEPNEYGMALTFDYDSEKHTHGPAYEANRIIGNPRRPTEFKLIGV